MTEALGKFIAESSPTLLSASIPLFLPVVRNDLSGALTWPRAQQNPCSAALSPSALSVQGSSFSRRWMPMEKYRGHPQAAGVEESGNPGLCCSFAFIFFRQRRCYRSPFSGLDGAFTHLVHVGVCQWRRLLPGPRGTGKGRCWTD